MKKILVVSPNWIGDALMITPAIRTIKRHYPDAQCVVFAVPRAAEIFLRNPDVTRVIVNEEESRPFWYYFGWIQMVGRDDFDAVFLFHRSRSRAIGMFLAGIPLRIGFDSKGRGVFLTHSIPMPQGVTHRMDLWQYLLRQVGISGQVPAPVFRVGAAVREHVRAILEAQGIDMTRGGKYRFAILNPGSNWPPRRWPVDRFAQLADFLASRMGVKVVISGAVRDRELAREIQKKSSTPLISMAGETSLEELGAMMELSQLVVSNDSGPMHLAAAVKAPLIALWGPTCPQITGPRGEGKIVVLQKDIGLPVPNLDPQMRDMRYMEAISVEEVFSAAEKILCDAAVPIVSL